MTTSTLAPNAYPTPALPAPSRPGRIAKVSRAVRRERWLMAIATGLVALHVADDSFLQPAAGTSAADHLAGGLVPTRIGGIGFSVGGEMMLEAAARNQDLAAVVSEGAGARTFSEDVQEYSGPELWISYPTLVMKTGAIALFSNTMPPEPLTTLVPHIAPRPVFLIWTPRSGTEGLNPAYQRLGGDTASIWKIPEAEHMQGITTRPQEYEQRVIGFFDDALLDN